MESSFHTERYFEQSFCPFWGVPEISFLDSSAAFGVLVGTYLWRNIGYDMILWLAGLDAIPASMYEAAEVDGANSWQIFWKITLPNLPSTMGLITILSILNTFKVYREAYLVAGNYPDDSIYLLQHLFNNWFLLWILVDCRQRLLLLPLRCFW